MLRVTAPTVANVNMSLYNSCPSSVSPSGTLLPVHFFVLVVRSLTRTNTVCRHHWLSVHLVTQWLPSAEIRISLQVGPCSARSPRVRAVPRVGDVDRIEAARIRYVYVVGHLKTSGEQAQEPVHERALYLKSTPVLSVTPVYPFNYPVKHPAF